MPLSGRKILVVEDEYLIADDLAALLREAGAEIIGPVASLPTAMRVVGDTQVIDAAVLDINLREVSVYPLVDELMRRSVPMVFMTGYGENNIPRDYAAIPRCEKPTGAMHVVGTLRALMESRSAVN